MQCDEWQSIAAPIRVDLAGGWTNLSIVSHQLGGCVVNVALKLEDRCPIGAAARFLSQPIVRLSTRKRSPLHSNGESNSDVKHDHVLFQSEFSSVADFLDQHDNPHSKTALLQCVLICMGVINPSGLSQKEPTTLSNLSDHVLAAIQRASVVSSDTSLPHQVGPVGLELCVWSELPKGTGLGVSSILAAAAIQVICKLFKRRYDAQSLTHLVLLVEQRLTTAGGWQDQVGALLPSFKRTTCVQPQLASRLEHLKRGQRVLTDDAKQHHIEAEAKMQVNIEVMASVAPDFAAAFSARSLLVYTGVSRLAKMQLQSVVHRWQRRDRETLDLFVALHNNADRMTAAISAGDLAAVGQSLNVYWQQKRAIANNAEPEAVSLLMREIRESESVLGMSLCGAGGGGFLFCLMGEPVTASTRNNIADILRRHGVVNQHITAAEAIYSAQVCIHEAILRGDIVNC